MRSGDIGETVILAYDEKFVERLKEKVEAVKEFKGLLKGFKGRYKGKAVSAISLGGRSEALWPATFLTFSGLHRAGT